MSAGSYGHARIHGIDPFVMPEGVPYQMFWRSVFGTLAFLCEISAIYLMPISLAITIYFTQPIFAGLFGYIFLGEKLNIFDQCGLVFALFGVLLIARPPVILDILSYIDKDVHV